MPAGLNLNNDQEFHRFLRRLHGHETHLDDQEDHNSPDSLKKKILYGKLVEISHTQFKEDFIQKLIRRWHRIKALLSALRAHRKGVDDEDDLEEEELRMQELRETLQKLEHRLDLSPIKFLNVLLKEREDLLSRIITAWRDQQARQVYRMADTMRESLNLDDDDIKFLSLLPKTEEILLTYPGLIPEGSEKQARLQEDIRLLINSARCHEANQSGKNVFNFGPKPDREFEEDNIYIYLENDVLFYATRNLETGENIERQIDVSLLPYKKEQSEFYINTVIRALKNGELVGLEAQKAVILGIINDGRRYGKPYSQKLDRADVDHLHASTLNKIIEANLKLKPSFENNHAEDEKKKEELQEEYNKHKAVNEKLRDFNTEKAVEQLEQDVEQATIRHGRNANTIPKAQQDYNSPTPFPMDPKPQWARAGKQ